MKKIAVIALGMCMFTIVAKAQDSESKYGVDSAKTILNASIYSELWKQKNYDEALPAWRYVFLHAPAFQLNTYLRGEDIIEHMIKKTNKPEYIDTLMMLYDLRIKYFGDHPRYTEGYILGKKGFSQWRYANGDVAKLKEAFTTLMKSYEMEGERSNPQALGLTLDIACQLVKKNEFSRDEFIDLYMKFADFSDKQLTSGSEGCEKFAQCKAHLDGIFFDSGFADCATLADLLGKKYEANKTDIKVLKEVYSILRRRECTDLPLYAVVSEEIYKQDPSAEAAYGLAMMFYSKKDYAKFESYLKEAVDKSEDPKAKADYNLKLAQVYVGKKNFPQVKRYALEALKLNPNLGQAYIIIGQAYAYGSTDFEGDEFDKHSVFWAAVDKFNKAKQVDPSVADSANELISKYSVYFPSKDEAFFRSITAGATVNIGGWINESTVARFKD